MSPCLRRLRGLALLLVILPLVTSCWLPDRFQSEIRLTETGEYGLYFQGDLTWLPLVRDLWRDAITEADVPEKMEVLKRDLTRDGHFEKVEAIGPGRFRVTYNRVGKLNWPELVTFVRRNARIISMETDPEAGTVSITGSQAIKLIDPQTIERVGLNSRGLFRVTTDAEVLEHNADSVKPGPPGFTIYDWNINGVRGQEPRLKARLRAH